MPAVCLGEFHTVLCEQFQNTLGPSKPTKAYQFKFHARVFKRIQNIGVGTAFLTGFFPHVDVCADVVSHLMHREASHHVCFKARQDSRGRDGRHVDPAFEMFTLAAFFNIPPCSSG